MLSLIVRDLVGLNISRVNNSIYGRARKDI